MVEAFIEEGFLSYDDLTFLEPARVGGAGGATRGAGGGDHRLRRGGGGAAWRRRRGRPRRGEARPPQAAADSAARGRRPAACGRAVARGRRDAPAGPTSPSPTAGEPVRPDRGRASRERNAQCGARCSVRTPAPRPRREAGQADPGRRREPTVQTAELDNRTSRALMLRRVWAMRIGTAGLPHVADGLVSEAGRILFSRTRGWLK